MFPFEFVYEMVHKTVVEVLTTQVSVTSGRLDLEDTLLNGQEGNIEGTTTQIENENVTLAISLLVKTIGNSSSSRLVDDTEHVETGNQTSILGGLTLGVVEVSRDGNDSVVDGTTQVRLSSLTHLGQDHGGDFLRSEVLLLTLELDLDDRLAGLLDDLEGEVLHISLNLSIVELAANETLGIEDGVGRVHGDLVFGGITDQTLSVCEGDEGRGSAVSLVVGDDFNAVITEDTHAGVRGTQIDTDCGGHYELDENRKRTKRRSEIRST